MFDDEDWNLRLTAFGLASEITKNPTGVILFAGQIEDYIRNGVKTDDADGN